MSDIDALRENMQEMSEKLDTLPSVDEKPKTALEILERREREDYWKSLLTYFLNPNEPHGMSADLLEEVLNQLPLEISFDSLELEDAKVVSEPQMDEGRADIAVYIEGEWFILFELKVGSVEGKKQTVKYVESNTVDGIRKEEFRGEGEFYVFVSRDRSSQADEFVDITWRHITDAINEVLTNSEGRYTAKGTAQLNDFRDSIRDIIEMDNTESQRIQEEKMKIFADYHSEIELLKDGFEETVERVQNEWDDRLLGGKFKPNGWGTEWHCRGGEGGNIYQDGWWLDEDGERTNDFDSLRYMVRFQPYVWNIRDILKKGEFKFRTSTYNVASDNYRDKMKYLFSENDEMCPV